MFCAQDKHRMSITFWWPMGNKHINVGWNLFKFLTQYMTNWQAECPALEIWMPTSQYTSKHTFASDLNKV